MSDQSNTEFFLDMISPVFWFNFGVSCLYGMYCGAVRESLSAFAWTGVFAFLGLFALEMCIIIIGIMVFYNKRPELSFFNFVAVILGIFIYVIAKSLGLSIAEFLNNSGVSRNFFSTVLDSVLPTASGYGVGFVVNKIAGSQAKFRVAIMFFIMLIFLSVEIFHTYSTSRLQIDWAVFRPNIFLVVGVLINILTSTFIHDD